MKLKQDPAVPRVFDNYPADVRSKLTNLRELILETASETQSVDELEETLKWGEPSYLTKKGSTVRIDWKPRAPDQYCMYFKCTSKLVPTFMQLYDDILTFENHRAIVFKLDDEIPVRQLKHCISLALTYHLVKHLPLLGN